MPEATTTLGPVTLRAFTLFLGLALAGSVAFATYRLSRWVSPGSVFDAFIGALLGAAVAGRLTHVVFTWDYFSLHPEDILNLNNGGLEWHGALAGGLLGLAIVSRWRKLPRQPLLNVLAPILPLVALGIWYGCWAASCGYGAEVDTLALYPDFAVSESRDVYGTLAPRYDTQRFGMLLSLGCLLLATVPFRQRAVATGRFWIVLMVFSAGMFAIGFFRGDPSPVIGSLRADQWLDLLVIACCALVLAFQWSRRRSAKTDLRRQ